MTDKHESDRNVYTCIQCERDNILFNNGEQLYDTTTYRCGECERQNIVAQAEVVWNYRAQRFDVKGLINCYSDTQLKQAECHFGVYCNDCDKTVNMVRSRKYIDKKDWCKGQ